MSEAKGQRVQKLEEKGAKAGGKGCKGYWMNRDKRVKGQRVQRLLAKFAMGGAKAVSQQGCKAGL